MTTATTTCNGSTKSGKTCSLKATVTMPASAFTTELHFCPRHADRYRKAVAAFYEANR